ncbi:hypothetical protein Hanom_Chr10g00949531 [Helianthus anomalus]
MYSGRCLVFSSCVSKALVVVHHCRICSSCFGKEKSFPSLTSSIDLIENWKLLQIETLEEEEEEQRSVVKKRLR